MIDIENFFLDCLVKDMQQHMQQSFQKNNQLPYIQSSLTHVPSVNMKEVGFKTHTTASQQGELYALWLHFQVIVTPSILIYSL